MSKTSYLKTVLLLLFSLWALYTIFSYSYQLFVGITPITDRNIPNLFFGILQVVAIILLFVPSIREVIIHTRIVFYYILLYLLLVGWMFSNLV